MIALLPDLVDGAYVGVIEGGCRLGLPQKTLFGALIGGDFSGEEFNSDFPAKLLVLSQVDLAHAAASELFYDAVVRDGLSDHWRESYVCETGKSMKAMQLARSQETIVVTSRLHSQPQQRSVTRPVAS